MIVGPMDPQTLQRFALSQSATRSSPPAWRRIICLTRFRSAATTSFSRARPLSREAQAGPGHVCRPSGPSPGPLARNVNVLAASPGRDQPGTRIDDHAALVAVVRRERLAQALDGMSRLGVAQAREGRARVLKPPHERERGVEVVSVEDRLVDVLEAYPVEAGAPEDAGGGFGLAERERVRARLR